MTEPLPQAAATSVTAQNETETSQERPLPPSGPALARKTELEEVVAGVIWTRLYYIKFAGADFSVRTTIVKLKSGKLWVHSPGGPFFDDEFKLKLSSLGSEVAFLIAPGTFHHMRLPEWQLAYPEAKTHVCPGIDTKRPDLRWDKLLTDQSDDEWKEDFEQIWVQGRAISEVLFFHKASKTLIVTDLVEFYTDSAAEKDGTKDGWGTWFWVNLLRMKNRVLPAPEYRFAGFPDKIATKAKLEHVLDVWKPERVILSHGELMNQEQKNIDIMLRQCWSGVLGSAPSVKVEDSNQTTTASTNGSHQQAETATQ